jgi:MoxR-like ATPase
VHPVLRHRIIPNFSAEAEGINSDVIVDKLIEMIPRAESEALADSRLPGVND